MRARPLRPFVWGPVAISLALVVVLLAVGYTLVQDAVAWFGEALPSWLGWLASGLAPLLYIIGILVAGWLFGFLAVIVASPFLGVLSAATERQRFGDGPVFEEGVGLALVHALLREGRKLVYHVPRLLGVFVISLLPLVNLVAPALWFAFGSWMLAVQFVDYAAENRGLDFRETLALLRANRRAAFGFGVLAALLLAVPFAALVVIPAGVCGGALLWRRLTA
ncbi:MAG: sulfate transporter CysZ [Pseudomonadales bacterium]|nr:sulfate transporter CysZ [Pseudomonadales bacterium]